MQNSRLPFDVRRTKPSIARDGDGDGEERTPQILFPRRFRREGWTSKKRARTGGRDVDRAARALEAVWRLRLCSLPIV